MCSNLMLPFTSFPQDPGADLSAYVNVARTLPPAAGSTAPLRPLLLLREGRSLGQKCCVWALGCSGGWRELGKAPTYQGRFFFPLFSWHAPQGHAISALPLHRSLWGCNAGSPHSCMPRAVGAMASGAVAVALRDFMPK